MNFIHDDELDLAGFITFGIEQLEELLRNHALFELFLGERECPT